MFRITNLTKSYGEATVLDQINFTLNRNDRVGLIGPNGAGKSTLLRIIAGLEQPDQGNVWLDPSVRIGYLAQALQYSQDATVGTVISEATGPALTILSEIERLGEEIALNPSSELLERYSEALEEAERLEAFDTPARLAQILSGLGLSHVNTETPVSILSGGQKTRLGLASLLLTQPDLLLLDEPTNHLDITALNWLQEFVQQYKGAVLIVSHDRAFLDKVVTKIFALDENTHTIKQFAGNYTIYAEELARQRQKLLDDYHRQQDYIQKVKTDIKQAQQHSRNIENETIDFYIRKRALKVARAGVVRRKKLEKLLNSEDKIEKPRQNWQVKMDFGPVVPSGQFVLALDGISKSYGNHLVFEQIKAELRQGERVTLLGPNGAGKTTLLKIISGDVAPDAGNIRLGTNVRIGYFSQEQEGLDPEQNVLDGVRAVAALSETDARNFLHFFLFSGDEVFKQTRQLSYGERARFVLARLILSGVNFLMLDEPFNHLDIDSREKFEQALDNFDGTILAVVHDRYFVENFAEKIWAILDGQLKVYLDLEDYERQLVKI